MCIRMQSRIHTTPRPAFVSFPQVEQFSLTLQWLFGALHHLLTRYPEAAVYETLLRHCI